MAAAAEKSISLLTILYGEMYRRCLFVNILYETYFHIMDTLDGLLWAVKLKFADDPSLKPWRDGNSG